ncbi:hypothetical protein GJ699_15835 [Duganella sp. FT80W]|uniref:PepSY domain-containing protein n=1 Tax=Duganella guangzhouensis TaxID=2666084 RepID=A0A6I2L0S9_9BURK|nr:PepSY-associated TM helix domain-containing protein [Duganella guangzhouensis]MRW91463.1 hypothetical protein [Duganella guangzhouensis]
MKLLNVHRWISIAVVLVSLYLSVTGTLIQLVDLKGLLLGSSPYDENLQAMRGDLNGPGDYAMIGPADYLAAPLPADLDYPAMFGKALAATRAAAGDTPLRYLELRQDQGRLLAIAQLAQPVAVAPGEREPAYATLVLDVVSGQPLPGVQAPRHNMESQQSLRIVVKSLHRMTTFGNNALWINVVVGTGLMVLIVTGVWIYVKQYRSRAALGRKALFWKAQDWWRTLHRSISVACAVFLMVVTVSGLWLAVESLSFGYYISAQIAQAQASGRPPMMRRDAMQPLPDAQVAQMARMTIEAYRRNHPDVAPRALRLRVFANYAQGVVISGEGEARQLVYNADSGAPMLQTEAGYPDTGFPFGWQAHQWAKQVHNGSMIGISGRAMNLLAGLALFYLSLSGIVMYVKLWRRRAANGRKALVW